MIKNNYKKILILGFFILIGILSRIIDHIPNFTPLVGMSLFLSYLWKKEESIVFVLSTMLISDLIIGFDSIEMRFIVYSSFLIPAFLGWVIKKQNKWYTKYLAIFSSSLISSIFFFLITNFGVWLWSGMYDHTMEGLIFCYTMAIPFFKNSLAGDLFSSFFIFGVYDLIQLFQKKERLVLNQNK